jgi:hypothetical protein
MTRAATNLGKRCHTDALDFNSVLLGGKDEPKSSTGWNIIKTPGNCTNHQNEFLLTSPFYDGYWKAYLTGFGWKAVSIGEVDPDRWCDEMASGGKDGIPNSEGKTTDYFTDQLQQFTQSDETTKMIFAAVAIVVITALTYIALR